jgi:hypothetical protein
MSMAETKVPRVNTLQIDIRQVTSVLNTYTVHNDLAEQLQLDEQTLISLEKNPYLKKLFVKFVSLKAAEDALKQCGGQIRIHDGAEIRVLPVSLVQPDATTLCVLNAPYELADEILHNVFLRFGRVISVRKLQYGPGYRFPNLYSGKRLVTLIPGPTDIPSFLDVCGHRLQIFSNQRRLCFHCKSPNHERDTCEEYLKLRQNGGVRKPVNLSLAAGDSGVSSAVTQLPVHTEGRRRLVTEADLSPVPSPQQQQAVLTASTSLEVSVESPSPLFQWTWLVPLNPNCPRINR